LRIRVENLNVSIDGFEIVKDFSMDIDRSSITAILGSSGSGKTTILRALIGVIPKIFPGKVKGVIIPSPDELQKHSFYMPQEPWYATASPFVWMEVEYFSKFIGDVYNYLKLLNIENLANRSIYTLSAGELQRLNIAIAASSDKNIIIFDEPLAHLDRDNMERVLNLLRKLRDEGRIIIVAEHREKILGISDEIYRLGTSQDMDPDITEIPLPPEDRGEEICRIDISEYGYPGQRPILKNIRFSISRGDIIWIRGPSGSGKSTLLKLIARMYSSSSCKAICRSKPVYVPENPLLFFSEPRPILEIIQYYYDDRCKDILYRLGLNQSMLSRPILSLSSGERRRAVIAIALCMKREITILDEPSIGLDPKNRYRLLNLLIKLAREGYTFVIASHEEEFKKIATSVVSLYA